MFKERKVEKTVKAPAKKPAVKKTAAKKAPAKKAVVKKAVVKSESKKELLEKANKAHVNLVKAQKAGDEEAVKKYNEEMSSLLRKVNSL